jgi:hypothetical protein
VAGVVHIPWYATVFRGDKLEAALAEIAPVALRYGASGYWVQRNRDDRYKFLQAAVFESKSDWERYWGGPEFTHFRIAAQTYYQVPVLYTWNDVVVEGYLDTERERAGLVPEAGAVGDVT